MRLAIIVALVALFVVAKVSYDRWTARLAESSGADLPRLPDTVRGPGRTWLVFATRYCATCGPVAAALERRYPDDTVRLLSVEDHGALADELAVRTAPTVVEVDADGTVVRTLAGVAAATEFQRSLSASGG